MSYLYLASPYTHPDPAVRQWRYEAVRDFAAFLCRKRQWIFCPIMHSHDMTINHQMPYEFEFWDDWNKSLIYPSGGVIVFQIDGWDISRGIKSEIEYAVQLGKPLMYSKVIWSGYEHPDNPFL
jgi:hypothetical protein